MVLTLEESRIDKEISNNNENIMEVSIYVACMQGIMVYIILLNSQTGPAGKYRTIIFPKLVSQMRKEQLREVRIRPLVKGVAGTQAQVWVTPKLGFIGTTSKKSHVSEGAIWGSQRVWGIKG